jgi:ABC-type glucose/galactose transport system permease subunit
VTVGGLLIYSKVSSGSFRQGFVNLEQGHLALGFLTLSYLTLSSILCYFNFLFYTCWTKIKNIAIKGVLISFNHTLDASVRTSTLACRYSVTLWNTYLFYSSTDKPSDCLSN